MIDLFAVLRNITLPFGAGPGQPRIVIGPDLPPPIKTYDFGFGTGIHADSGIIFYFGSPTDDDYSFLVHVAFPGQSMVWLGHVLNGAVLEASQSAPAGQSWSFFGGAVVENNFYLHNTGNQLIDGRSVPRGLKDRASAAVGTGAVGAEAVVLTGGTITWEAGRAYEVIGFGDTSGSIASNTAFLTLRRNNVAGTILAAFQQTNSPTAGNGTTIHARIILRNNTGADVIDNIVLTLLASGGGTVSMAGGGVYSFVRYLEVRDVGAAFDYPNATQI